LKNHSAVLPRFTVCCVTIPQAQGLLQNGKFTGFGSLPGKIDFAAALYTISKAGYGKPIFSF